MPLFQSFQDLKGFTNNINPLNLFTSEQPPTAPQSAPATVSSTNTSANATPTATRPGAGAIAGPGPSSAARRALGISSSSPSTPSVERLDPLALGKPVRPSVSRQSSSPAPIRPSLKHAGTSSSSPGSSDSSESGTRRKTSGANVSIAEPEITGGEQRRRTPVKRGPRPASTASGMTNVSGVDAEGRARRRKKPMDTYIIVKPPPTSGKNPLNLQIQLVVKPDRRGRDRSASGISSRSGSIVGEGIIASAPPSPSAQMVDLPTESSDVSDSPDSAPPRSASPESTVPLEGADQPSPGSPKSVSAESESSGTGLKRSSSIRSSISTSTAATGSSSASGKRIEPMFNLAVHNVMQPTVVTDAATDVKVAKFHKRDLDITGVGILVPSEVWHQSQAQGPNLFSAASRVSDDGNAVGGRNRPLSLVSLTTPLSPTLSRSDDGKSGLRGSLDLKGFKFDNLRSGGSNKSDGQEGGARKFFGKVFKKKTSMGDIGLNRHKKTSPSASFSSHDGSARAGLLSPNGHTAGGADTLHPSTAAASRSHAVPPSQASVDFPSAALGNPTFGTAPIVVRRRSSGAIVTPEGAVTGLTAHVDHATLQTGDEPAATRMERCQSLPIIPSNRPVGYTWTVKRWAKKNTEGWAAHLVAAANAGLEMVGGGLNGEGEDEVVFEWVKLRVPSTAAGDEILRRYSTTGAISTTRTRARSQVGSSSLAPHAGSENPASRSQTSLSVQPSDQRNGSPFPPSSPNLNSSTQASPFGSPRLDGRPEPVRKLSASVSPSRRTSQTTLDVEANSIHGGDLTANEDEDSDPEDSETPWTCSVWVKKTGQRQLLGTLTPAPHHPKVIGVLKIPMGLDSVSLTDFKEKDSTITSKTRSSAATTASSREVTAKKVKEGIALSEENLKDVVCVTAMWLVAREEFGGLGRKKSRRGTAA
ncbi:hypothetical protein I317_04597 [Kwoniella heveanensis CBS 569]|nr:hypothetical protein I317_04597 [Kwoniella heveanensis CBS 569]